VLSELLSEVLLVLSVVLSVVLSELLLELLVVLLSDFSLLVDDELLPEPPSEQAANVRHIAAASIAVNVFLNFISYLPFFGAQKMRPERRIGKPPVFSSCCQTLSLDKTPQTVTFLLSAFFRLNVKFCRQYSARPHSIGHALRSAHILRITLYHIVNVLSRGFFCFRQEDALGV